MRSVTVRAFAKINLSLSVGAVRADGYHAVQTVLQAIDLFDTVRVARRRGPFEIRCDADGVPRDRTNLIWRAAELVWKATGGGGEPRDLLVTLRKRIPMQAGLGGGSSDAAAALVALGRLWRLRLLPAEQHAMAAQIGSDVPYFLVGGTALGVGRGEEVYPLEDLPRFWVALAFPPLGVSTRDAYAWLDESRKRGREEFSADTSGSAENSSRPLFPHLALANDLEAPVVARHPQIGALTQRLRESGALMAAMSGSGSTVFGVFTTDAAAKAAARKVRTPGTRTGVARFLSRRAARRNLPGSR